MQRISAIVGKEIASALGALAILVLTLLAPVHAVAETRASLGDEIALVYCFGNPHDPEEKPHLGLACDLCAVAHVAKVFDKAPAPILVAPLRIVSLATGFPQLARTLRPAILPEPRSRGPPRT